MSTNTAASADAALADASVSISSLSDRISLLHRHILRHRSAAEAEEQLRALNTNNATNTNMNMNRTEHNTIMDQIQSLQRDYTALLSAQPHISHYLTIQPHLQSAIDRHTDLMHSSVELAAEQITASAAAATNVNDIAATSRRDIQTALITSSAPSLERTASQLETVASLTPILDKPWPVPSHTAAALSMKLDKLIAEQIHPLAYSTAQREIELNNFLNAYASLIDLCNQQFIQWNKCLQVLEEKVAANAQK